MQTQALWELFRDTGAPEAYLLYKRAMQEGDHDTKAEWAACICKRRGWCFGSQNTATRTRC